MRLLKALALLFGGFARRSALGVAHGVSGLFAPRNLPAIGTSAGVVTIVASQWERIEWGKVGSIVGSILILAAQVVKHARDLNGLGGMTRTRFEDHETRIHRLEMVMLDDLTGREGGK